MNRRALVGAVLVALVAAAGSARAAPPTPIPPASLFAIERTAFMFGMRTVALPSAYSFVRWGQEPSNVPGHVSRDAMISYAGPDGAIVTWSGTAVTAPAEAQCAELFGIRVRRFTVGRLRVYTTAQHGRRVAWMCVADYTPPDRFVYRLRAGRQFSAQQLAMIVGRSRYRSAYAVSPFTDFWTPSRNIGCFASIPGQGLDDGVFMCYVRSGLVPSPGPATELCRASPTFRPFGWGDIVSITLPVSGPPDQRSYYDCAEYEPVDTSAPTLSYGRSMRYRDVTCRSERIGLRCANRFGHGFFLSRQFSYLF